jgi:wobble nucleotide-excising tRNase
MRIWHIFQLEVRGLGEILNDVQAFNAEQYEGKENDVNKLNREKQNTERRSFLKSLECQTCSIVANKHNWFPTSKSADGV